MATPRYSQRRPLRWRKLFCVLAHVITVASAPAIAAEAAPPPRHVFLIVVDTLRADHLSPYGYARDTSPFLAELAAEGVLFENAYSASSFTREAMAAIYTGAYPSATATGAGWKARPAPGIETLPELFQRAGYATAFYADTPMLDDPGFARGFDESKFLPEYNRSLTGPSVIANAKAFLEKNRARNTFLYLHLLDPHSPYEPPADHYARFGGPRPAAPLGLDQARANVPALRAEGFGPGEARFEDLIRAYDGEIAYQDDLLRGLAEWLRVEGFWDDSFIAFTSDHGEEFLEHDFVEHAWRIYVESIHVPLILWAGPRLVPGREARRVSNVGLFPTFAAVAGLDVGARAFGFGPLLAQEGARWRAEVAPAPIISELQLAERCMLRSVIVDDYHYIAAQRWLPADVCADASLVRMQRRLRHEFQTGVRKRPGPWGALVREELFNLAADPREQNDLAPAGGAVLEACRAALDAYREQCAAAQPQAER